MKIATNVRIAFAALVLSCPATACTDKKQDAETQEEQNAGAMQNDENGVQNENRDNQFPESRSDNKEGTGLETGAPTDTIDGDGDTKARQ